MKGNFKKVIPFIFREEGGYVDNSIDPGGATNMGITAATLSAWEGHPVTSLDVQNLSAETATRIYHTEYWNKISGDDLPLGVDYAVFDFAVNSGPARAARALENVLGVSEDGIIGAQTLAALAARSPKDVINTLCDLRENWLKRLSTASTFGKAWLARVERVRSRALALADEKPIPASDGAKSATPTPKASQSDLSLTSALKHPEALGSMGSVISGLAAIATGNGPVQYALAVIMVACAVAGLWYFVRRVRYDS